MWLLFCIYFTYINPLSVVKTPSEELSKLMEYLILKNCSLFHVVFQSSVQPTLRKKSLNERRTSLTLTEGNCIYIVDLCRMLS